MRTIIAVSTAALILLVAPAAYAAPTEVNVRIEGRSETLFEGPILTEGHNVKASSDKSAPAGGRRCNGLNNNQHPIPGPTPTASAVDAMGLLGEDFDGQWYAQYDDYFIKRWGPDGQDEAKGEYWGVVVNNVFTSVGGCQYQLDGGGEVLWNYDAFRSRPQLGLYPTDYGGGPRLLTATAEPGQPFEVEVVAWDGNGEGAPPASPQRTGSEPFEGAEVAPVVEGPGGFERAAVESPATVTTGANGRAAIAFAQPGWHRIKATVAGSGKEGAVRSNRLDVCVPDPPAAGCGSPPPDDLVRTPPAGEPGDPGEEEPEGPGGGPGPGTGPGAGGPALPSAGQGPTSPPATIDDGQVEIELPRLDRRRIARGLVGISWRVLDAGVGISRWTVSSRRLGIAGARPVIRATGIGRTSALLRLPLGASYQLSITIADALGRSSTAAIGRVRVPPSAT
jgi:hypothetical protein